VQAIQVIPSALLHNTRHGSPVRIEGLGRFGPTIGRDATIRHTIAPDLRSVRALSDKDGYRGQILNRKAIGLDVASYKALL